MMTITGRASGGIRLGLGPAGSAPAARWAARPGGQPLAADDAMMIISDAAVGITELPA